MHSQRSLLFSGDFETSGAMKGGLDLTSHVPGRSFCVCGTHSNLLRSTFWDFQWTKPFCRVCFTGRVLESIFSGRFRLENGKH
ncbi:hypothetical protein NPIL_109181 [Nephila pilipes]|uniref:Uncharacterized protein n=1 Tax=Nephila pilipes TaxID=299642 RepID=A0A8X6MQ68_NEPPI|nr:hypothetical protein NPIL_109181 [Nephila pilipes]